MLQRECSHNGIGVHHNFIALISTLKTILEKHTPLLSGNPDVNENLLKKLGLYQAKPGFNRHKNRFFSITCKNRTPSATVAWK